MFSFKSTDIMVSVRYWYNRVY